MVGERDTTSASGSGVPAGLLFLLLLATPFSDNAKAASEEDGAPELEALLLLSNMGGKFLCFEDYMLAHDQILKTSASCEVAIVGFSALLVWKEDEEE